MNKRENLLFDHGLTTSNLLYFRTNSGGIAIKKLILILRRQYRIMLSALGEKYILRIGLRRYVTPPNTEYIFFQLAVNIMRY